MSTETPEMGQWLSLSCPRCKAKLRIKSAYGHMSGRCPNCGKPIEPPLPALPASPGSFDLDEPSGLVPIEEEWPEPAQLEGEDGRPLYEFGSVPTQWAEPKPPKPPELEGYGLEGGPSNPAPTPRTPEPLPEAYSVTIQNAISEPGLPSHETLAEAYPVDLPHAGPSPARSEIPRDAYQATLPELAPLPFPVATPVVEENKEKIPPLPPLPPSRPLWEGVYTFPWHLGCLKLWLFLGLEIAIIGFLAAALYHLIYVTKILDMEGWHPEAAILVLIIPLIVIIAILTSAYGAANFITALEEAAAGNDTFEGPELVGEWFGYLLRLLWIAFCSLIPSITIGVLAANVYPANWGWLTGAFPALLTFPIFLLSSLARNSRLAVIDGHVILAFLRNPRSLFVLLAVSALLGAICLELGYLTLTRFHILWALAMGLVWSACILIYARLLGRVAWVISQGSVKVKKRKKRRKKPTPGPDDWGSGTESTVAEKPVSP